MPNLIDLTGKKFGMLEVLRRAGTKQSGTWKGPTWLCRCDCGTEKEITGAHLRHHGTRSCGCIQKPHGMYGTPEYSAWQAMIRRCTKPQDKAWRLYGGRGIAVCKRWASFPLFLADMGRRPSSRHSIDRIDNNGNYEPGNCRWATVAEQLRNRRNTRVLTAGGESATLLEWAARLGVGSSTLSERLRRGWSHERIVMEPVKRRRSAAVGRARS